MFNLIELLRSVLYLEPLFNSCISMKVNGKIIVVTGAGSGMGRAMCIQLVKKGARVAMVDIHAEDLQQTAELAGQEAVSVHVVNVTDMTAVQALPEAVVAHHGSVDGLINNAGIIQPFVPVNELDYAVIDRVMQVNFWGTIYLTKTFLPHLLARPEAHIVNVSSMGGFIPFPGQTIYSASKAAVKILTEGLYAELKDTSVRVTVMHPGAVNTNIMKNSDLSMPAASAQSGAPSMLSAEKAAQIMIEGMERNKLRVMVGSDAKLLDILYRISPKRAIDFIVAQMKKVGR